jgi:hypothetical protein
VTSFFFIAEDGGPDEDSPEFAAWLASINSADEEREDE